MSKDAAVPFLRWAGGKTWLVRRLDALFGELRFTRYHEPFLGGGAFFFGLPERPTAFLSDSNAELIETYEAVVLDVEKVICELSTFEQSSPFYYSVRAEIPACRYRRAARFIYLNQTSYNGLYRVNLKGKYNVPYGFRTKPFLDAAALRRAAQALRGAILSAQDFGESLKNVQRGDLVFIDPPYTVSHNMNGFIKYNQSLFSLDDQYRLAEGIREIRNRGGKYILTNAAHESIRGIFDLGDSRLEVSRASLIGGKKAERGHVSEYIFTNLDVVEDGNSERRELFGSDGRSGRSANPH
jgi:DNA adenine methylase